MKKLIGLDPAAASLFLSRKYYIQKGDASYVQLIHTSTAFGTTNHSGDVSIVVTDNRYSFWSPVELHSLATSIHAATCRKRLIIVADLNKKELEKDTKVKKTADNVPQGILKEFKDPKSYKVPELKETQCIVGIYSEFKPSMEGKVFELDLTKRTHVLWNSIK